MLRLFFLLITLVVRALQVALWSRSSLVLENIALRQQVGVLTKTRPRPPLDNADRAFWVAMKCARRNWAQLLFIVEPETVVKWHRELFRRYWTHLSRRRHGPGRPRMDREIRQLIRRMALENDWGAPRIHGELEKLGSPSLRPQCRATCRSALLGPMSSNAGLRSFATTKKALQRWTSSRSQRPRCASSTAGS